MNGFLLWHTSAVAPHLHIATHSYTRARAHTTGVPIVWGLEFGFAHVAADDGVIRADGLDKEGLRREFLLLCGPGDKSFPNPVTTLFHTATHNHTHIHTQG